MVLVSFGPDHLAPVNGEWCMKPVARISNLSEASISPPIVFLTFLVALSKVKDIVIHF